MGSYRLRQLAGVFEQLEQDAQNDELRDELAGALPAARAF